MKKRKSSKCDRLERLQTVPSANEETSLLQFAAEAISRGMRAGRGGDREDWYHGHISEKHVES